MFCSILEVRRAPQFPRCFASNFASKPTHMNGEHWTLDLLCDMLPVQYMDHRHHHKKRSSSIR